MEPLETDGGLQIARTETGDSEYAVVTALEQLFTGLRYRPKDFVREQIILSYAND